MTEENHQQDYEQKLARIRLSKLLEVLATQGTTRLVATENALQAHFKDDPSVVLKELKG